MNLRFNMHFQAAGQERQKQTKNFEQSIGRPHQQIRKSQGTAEEDSRFNQLLLSGANGRVLISTITEDDSDASIPTTPLSIGRPPSEFRNSQGAAEQGAGRSLKGQLQGQRIYTRDTVVLKEGDTYISLKDQLQGQDGCTPPHRPRTEEIARLESSLSHSSLSSYSSLSSRYPSRSVQFSKDFVSKIAEARQHEGHIQGPVVVTHASSEFC